MYGETLSNIGIKSATDVAWILSIIYLIFTYISYARFKEERTAQKLYLETGINMDVILALCQSTSHVVSLVARLLSYAMLIFMVYSGRYDFAIILVLIRTYFITLKRINYHEVLTKFLSSLPANSGNEVVNVLRAHIIQHMS